MTSYDAHKSLGRRLKIIICGGGIAGFATASLLREEHDVIVLEQSALNLELGAAITFSMNASRVMRSSLQRAGFDKELARFVEAEKVRAVIFMSHAFPEPDVALHHDFV
jgi:salicylate hydroxylase